MENEATRRPILQLETSAILRFTSRIERRSELYMKSKSFSFRFLVFAVSCTLILKNPFSFVDFAQSLRWSLTILDFICWWNFDFFLLTSRQKFFVLLRQRENSGNSFTSHFSYVFITENESRFLWISMFRFDINTCEDAESDKRWWSVNGEHSSAHFVCLRSMSSVSWLSRRERSRVNLFYISLKIA